MSLDYQYSNHERFLPAALEDRLVGLFARVGGLALLVVVAIVWLALLTWSSTDPSLMHATGGDVSNLLGYTGATIADLMLQTFGIATAMILLAPMFWGLELMLAKRINAFGAKATYFPLAILILAGAFSSLPMIDGWPLHHGYGGILGDAVYRLATSLVAIGVPERAGPLTGLICFALGSASVAYSVGIELKDVTAAIKDRATAMATSARTEPVLDAPHEPETTFTETPLPQTRFADAREQAQASARIWQARLGATWDRTVATVLPGRGSPPQYANPEMGNEGYDAYDNGQQQIHAHHNAPHQPQYETYQPAQNAVAPQQYAPQGAPVYAPPQQPQHRAPATAPAPNYAAQPQQRYAPQHHQPAQHVRQPAPAPVPAPARPIANPRAGTPTQQPINRGDEFDGTTDLASRNIAQRFAPAIAKHAQQQPLPPQNQSPAPAPTSGQLARPETQTHHPRQQPQPRQPSNAPQPPQAAPASRPPVRPGPKAKTLLNGLSFNTGPQRYQRPSLNLLDRPSSKRIGAHLTKTVLRGNARLLEDVLSDYGIKGEIRDIKPGPIVTLFELEPARGTKASRVIGLAEDIARSMSARSARVSVIEGRNVIGIELPNARKDPILLRDILESETFRTFKGTLPIALGKSITGDPVIADLAQMPHLLIAGTTGSGKSVGVNAIITSLLYRFGPEQCKLLMIDPKMLELSVYNGIPHLLTPVVTDPHQAVSALNWVVSEMEERYKRMSKMSVRNIDLYNNRVRNAHKRDDLRTRSVQTGFDRHTGNAVFEKQATNLDMEPMPYIVVVIDEFADLMATAGKEVEAAVQRLAQMARAAGIHLIMATQRPSVDVITGTIKANFPTRISFKVASKIDSRTILGEQGAEQLLGQGDMLYANAAGNALRVHGPFVSDEEVESISRSLRERYEPNYIDGVTDPRDDDTNPKKGAKSGGSNTKRDDNDLYDRAVALVLRDGKASTSYLQRRLSIGYNRAADLIERMETEKIISAANANGRREVTAPKPDAD